MEGERETLYHGDHDGAVTLFEERVTLSEEVGERANLAYCLEGWLRSLERRERRSALHSSSAAPKGCMKQLGRLLKSIMSRTAHYMSTLYLPYAPI